MGVSFVIPSSFTATDKFSSVMRNMGNATQTFVSRSERYLGRFNMMFTNLMKPVSAINKMLMGLGYYVGLFTLVRIIKNAIDIFADFEQANKNLALVMGTTVKENRVLASEARRIGLAYGESATDVVKMQHALATLGYEQKDILKMGKPLITGASALEGANPERLAEVVGSVINAFDNLTSKDTQHILDAMTLSANRTALTFDKLATTLPTVSGPANTVNISFEETLALLGILANAGVHVATSATSIKNIFIDSAKKGHTYNQVIDNIIKNSDKLVYANKQFGKKSVVSALAIAQHMHDAKNGVVALTKEFTNAKIGLTDLIAAERVNTFRGAQKLLNAAYTEFVLAIEDGNGVLAQSLTRYLRVASAVLLLAADSDQAREAISKMDAGIVKTANSWLFWLKVIGYAAAALLAMKAILILWRAALLIATVVQGAFSVALGVSAAAGWANAMAMRGNAIALGTYRVVAGLATAAQWAFNVAMNANPVILVATAVLGLAAALGVLDTQYNKINGSMSRWQKVFKDHPEFEGKRPDLSKRINYQLQSWLFNDSTAASWMIKDLHERMDTKNSGLEEDPNYVPINPKLDGLNGLDSLMNAFKGKIDLNINDPGGNVGSVDSTSNIMPRVSNTNTFQ